MDSTLGMSFSRGTVVACKACSGCVMFGFAIVLFVLLLGSSVPIGATDDDISTDSICGFTFSATSDYRGDGQDGAPLDDAATGTPNIYSLPILAYLDAFNVLWLVFAALIWDWLWLTVGGIIAYWGVLGNADSYFSTIERDHNWYRWIQWGASHPLYFLAVLIVAGATNWPLYVQFTFIVVAWIFAFSVNEAYHIKRSANVTGGSMRVRYVYEAVLIAAVLFIVSAVPVFAYASTTTAVDLFTLNGLVWRLSLSVYLVYLIVFVVVGVVGHTFFGFLSVSGKELFYELCHFVVVSLVTWIIAGYGLSQCP